MNRIQNSLATAAAAVLILLLPIACRADVRFEAESGAAFAGYNDVRIPGTTGTEFSLTDDLEIDPSAFVRFRLSYCPAPRHTLSLLVAPLRLEATGTVGWNVRFEETIFPAGTPLTATYRFDSYRLTYRYRLHDCRCLQFGLGLTAKIRDAEVSVQSADAHAEKTNTGFVPLINFRLEWLVSPRLDLLLTGDALAAPQGRAEDILLAIRYRVDRRIAVRAGYRILEGGADVDEVYNFALVHYATLGAELTF